MKNFTDSLAFRSADEAMAISAKMKRLLHDGMKPLSYNDIKDNLNIIKRVYKSPIVSDIINAIQNGILLPFYTETAAKMPGFEPFIRYKQGGVTKVAVDLTNYINVKYDSETEENIYSIEIKELYIMLLGAYYLIVLTPETRINVDAGEIASRIWAKSFAKVLSKQMGLTTNRDKYNAVLYFAAKFFAISVLEFNEAIADGFVLNDDGKTNTIKEIEYKVSLKKETHSIDMFQNFESFCKIIFDDSITGIKSMRISKMTGDMNATYFRKCYADMFGINTLLTLESFPHFLWTFSAAANGAYKIVKVKAFDDLYTSNDYLRFMAAMSKSISSPV